MTAEDLVLLFVCVGYSVVITQLLCVQIQVKQQKDWALHIDAVDVTDKIHRISLSNIYKPGSDRV